MYHTTSFKTLMFGIITVQNECPSWYDTGISPTNYFKPKWYLGR